MAFDFNTCNKSNYKKRADYGVRVARPGYDANLCEQNQLIFNSNWPIIQITSVINLNKPVQERTVWLSEDLSTGSRSWSETEPSGISYYYTNDLGYVAMGKNYFWLVIKQQNGRVGSSPNITYWTKYTYKKFYHGLGYPALFYRSEEVSALTGYVLITSVDMSRDIDYPYTEGATAFLGSLGDYGIKSESIFGSRVPGLCSDMFSKLVQAVKTEETSKATNTAPMAGPIIWSPLDKLENYQYCLRPYEAIAFNGYNNPFSLFDFGNNNTEMAGYGGDGPYYVNDGNSLVRAISAQGDGNASTTVGDGVAFTNKGQGIINCKHSVMVIIRSPMVSPEYEVAVINTRGTVV